MIPSGISAPIGLPRPMSRGAAHCRDPQHPQWHASRGDQPGRRGLGLRQARRRDPAGAAGRDRGVAARAREAPGTGQGGDPPFNYFDAAGAGGCSAGGIVARLMRFKTVSEGAGGIPSITGADVRTGSIRRSQIRRSCRQLGGQVPRRHICRIDVDPEPRTFGQQLRRVYTAAARAFVAVAP